MARYEEARRVASAFPDDPAIIVVRIDGVESNVPEDDANRDYVEIMRLVAAGELILTDPE